MIEQCSMNNEHGGGCWLIWLTWSWTLSTNVLWDMIDMIYGWLQAATRSRVAEEFWQLASHSAIDWFWKLWSAHLSFKRYFFLDALASLAFKLSVSESVSEYSKWLFQIFSQYSFFSLFSFYSLFSLFSSYILYSLYRQYSLYSLTVCTSNTVNINI